MGSHSKRSRGAQLLEEWRAGSEQSVACEILDLDPASYSRFENGVRKPSGEVGFRIERLTKGAVPATSWYEPAREKAKAS